MTADAAQSATSVADAAELLAQLVRIDSTNPDLIEGGSGEGEIVAFIADWCTTNGLDVEHQEVAPGRQNVIATARGNGNGKTLMLNGHTDTVTTTGMSEPFSASVAEGRLCGRGSYDMKGGLAAAMLACAAAAKRELSGDVVLAAVVDEEGSSQGTERLLETHAADAAIVMEPTELEVGIAHKGCAHFRIETEGRAAHGGRPDLGIDATVLMGPVLTRIGELNRALASGEQHPTLGSASMHASLIEGGQEITSYSGACTLRGGRRTLPGEKRAQVERELDELLGDAPGSAAILLWHEAYEIAADDPFVELVAEVSDLPLGAPFYWADSALLGAAGIPTVLLGPKGDGAHTVNEWVEIKSVERCADVYLDIARHFCA